MFNTENTQGTAPNSLNGITIGDAIMLPSPTFSRTGYSMTGWNTGNNSSGVSLSIGNTTVDALFIQTVFTNGTEKTLYPEWMPIQYSYVFNVNGGDGNPPNTLSSLTVISGATIPEVNITRTGYNATIWNTSPDGSGFNVTPGSMSITADVIEGCFASNETAILYPKWSAKNYSILFNTENTQGTAPQSLSNIRIGNTITLPSPTFSRTGYRMIGWNTGNEGSGLSLSIGNTTVDVSFIQTVFENNTEKTLYPEWSLVEYSYAFNANSGVGNPPNTLSSLTVISGAMIPEVNITRVGYTATVWNTSPDGSGINITPGSLNITAEVIGNCFSSGETATLYPKWIARSYSILFNTDNTQGTAPQPLSNITIGDTITLPSPTFARTGYSMTGWNTGNESSGTSLSIGDATVDSAFIQTVFASDTERTLYPEWTLIGYSYVFNNNGGSGNTPGTLSSITVVSGTTIPEVDIIKIGYSATLWNTSPDGTGINIAPGSLSITADIIAGCFSSGETATLYPKWTAKTYSISFNTDDTYGTTPGPISFTIGTQITMPEASFSRTGYDMSGWNSSNDMTGLSLTTGEVTADAGFIQSLYADGTAATFYPVWAVKNYKISLTTDRGGITGDQWTREGSAYSLGYNIESENITLPSVESDDRFHYFVCWEDKDGNAVSSIPSGSFGDISLDAVWGLKEMTVNFIVNGETVSERHTIDSVLNDPESEDGFAFKGWYYKDQEGNEIEFTSMSQMYEGMSLYAVFEPVDDEPAEIIISAALLLIVFSVVMMAAFRKR